jgi:hypothetical protein
MPAYAIALLVLASCRCTPTTQPETTVLPHYSEWPLLTTLVATGRVDQTHIVARDLTEGDEDLAHGMDEALADVGGALGFLQVFDDASDGPAALLMAAKGCGVCHQAIAMVSPPRPEWSHAQAAPWITYGIVWGEPTIAIPPLNDVDTQGTIEEVLQRCVNCHSKR